MMPKPSTSMAQMMKIVSNGRTVLPWLERSSMIRHQVTQLNARRRRAIAQGANHCVGQARLIAQAGLRAAEAQDRQIKTRHQPQARAAWPAQKESVVAGEGFCAGRHRPAVEARAGPLGATGS